MLRRQVRSSLPGKHSGQRHTSRAQRGNIRYRLIEDVEDLHRYRSGGYHPVYIGNDLNNDRYQVVDKFGYGGYSTIWLARDHQNARYVAVKIVTADTSDGMSESTLMKDLQQ